MESHSATSATQKLRSLVLSQKVPRLVSREHIRLPYLRCINNRCFWYRSSKEKSPNARICRDGKPSGPKAHSASFTISSASGLVSEGLLDMAKSSSPSTSESSEWQSKAVEASLSLVPHDLGWKSWSVRFAFEHVPFRRSWLRISSRIFLWDFSDPLNLRCMM